MPAILKLYLSYQLFPLLIGMYMTALLLILIGFRVAGVKRRKDVIMRGALMHGTYIFLSHALGVMFYSLVLLGMYFYGVDFNVRHNVILTLLSMLAVVGIYAALAKYLWLRIALSRKEANRIIGYSLIFVIPWYFLMNFL